MQIWHENENSVSRFATACKFLGVGKCEPEGEDHVDLGDFSFSLYVMKGTAQQDIFLKTQTVRLLATLSS